MYTATKITILALGLGVAGVVTARAQNNANLSVTALVQQPIIVAAGSNVDFGQVFPGVNKSITLASAGAGRFDVLGQANAGASMTFVVPANLVFSGNNLGVTWNASWNGVNDPAGTTFTPSGSATPATFGGLGQLFVFVAGTVTPTVSQPAGSYTGTISLTVTY